MTEVLDLIISYENRISMVEELLSTAYQTVATSDGSLIELDKETERLRISLRETLVKNCSLRRKDFDNLMEKVLADSERKRKEIEEEQKQVRKELKDYLDEQKALTSSVKEELTVFTQKKTNKDSLTATIDEFRSAYQKKGRQVFALLRNFQSRLEIFQREQEEINHKLQRLVSRGESLRIEDLRQLEAVKSNLERKSERELRREDVKKLLYHFRYQRKIRGHQQH
jgi:chromosome segregation ATPase